MTSWGRVAGASLSYTETRRAARFEGTGAGTLAELTKMVPPSPRELTSTRTAAPSSIRNWSRFLKNSSGFVGVAAFAGSDFPFGASLASSDLGGSDFPFGASLAASDFDVSPRLVKALATGSGALARVSRLLSES